MRRTGRSINLWPILLLLLVGACAEAMSRKTDVSQSQRQADGLLRLTCSGTTAHVMRGAMEFQQVIYLDTAAATYCRDDCRVLEHLISQSNDRVVFRDRPSDGYYLVDYASWSPSTGRYEARFAATTRFYTETETTAFCVAEPYEGTMPGRLLPSL